MAAPASATASTTATPSTTTRASKGAIRPMDQTESPAVSIVEINGLYEGCVDREGTWSVAVNGDEGELDNTPLMVVEGDQGCQLIVTEVRADQLYEAATPILLGWWFGSQPSAFTPADSDGGAGQVAFYASGANMDPDYYGDFMLLLEYSAGASQTTTGSGATYATSSASAVTEEIPAPDYSVDLSQMVIQTDAYQTVIAVSGSASFTFGGVPGSGYVIDDGTLPSNPTFAQLDAIYTSQSPTQIPWSGEFSLDATAFQIQYDQLPVVRSVVIGSAWGDGPSSYQVLSITFEPANDPTPSIKRLQAVRK